MESWRRDHADKPIEYMLEVSDTASVSPLLVLNSFPELMDLIARWAPAAQAAAVTSAITQIWDGHLQDRGFVESIAARAAYGITHALPQMQLDKQAHEVRQARRHGSR